MVREHLAEMVKEGLVDPTGLISHGRGEAFDYLMGEKTIPPAREAERAAAAFLLKARNPVVCMNGNSIALDPQGMIALARAVPAKMEVNIFHRTEERMEKLIGYMESQGASDILGLAGGGNGLLAHEVVEGLAASMRYEPGGIHQALLYHFGELLPHHE